MKVVVSLTVLFSLAEAQKTVNGGAIPETPKMVSVDTDYGWLWQAAARNLEKVESNKTECLECEEYEKELYIYKEFDGGVMFHDAAMAPNNFDDLAHCILAPVHTKEDLIKISDVVPPCKAAYTAAYKNPLQQYSDIHDCLDMYYKTPPPCNGGYDFDSIIIGKGKCDVTNLYTPPDHYRTLEEAEAAKGELWCPALRDYWVNFGSENKVPDYVWQFDEPYYCGSGPIPYAGVIPYTEYKYGYPYVGLVAVNAGETLPGAVYKCCRNIKSCVEDGKPVPTDCPSKEEPTPAPVKYPPYYHP